MDTTLNWIKYWRVVLYTLICVTPNIGQAPGGGADGANCPKRCFCNPGAKITYCSRRGLSYIPSGIPADSQQLNLNGNIFKTTVIGRSNFTELIELEHLYMSECGIEIVQVDTFVDLTKLKWLDLSNNRIKTIPDGTFQGLNLMHLFLNGNRKIVLGPSSFEGLVTTGLYLQDCSISKLDVDILAPLNSTLSSLWLYGNELERLDRNFMPVFASLTHLRLYSNPFHCNCEILWLKEFFDKNGPIFEGASPPSCLTPAKYKSKYFNEITLFDFMCIPPIFNNIDAVFNHQTGNLKCTATGDPAPTLYWIQPSGRSSRYNPPKKDGSMKTEGVLTISPYSAPLGKPSVLTGQYYCVAINDAGNVTLSLNVTWPTEAGSSGHVDNYRPPYHVPTSTTTTSGYGAADDDDKSSEEDLGFGDGEIDIDSEPNNAEDDDIDLYPPLSDSPQVPKIIIDEQPTTTIKSDSKYDSKNDINNDQNKTFKNLTALNMYEIHRREGGKYFNLTELIGAIIGTHVCTLLLCLIFLPIYYRRKWRNASRHPSLEKPPPETLFLNGSGQQSYSDYMDTPTPTKR